MHIKKSLLVLGAVTGIGLVGVTGLGVASAATDAPSGKTDSIIDKLAVKFHLDKGEVTQVFEETRAEREAKHQQRLEERLDQAIKDGKLTEEQKTKILAKLEELRNARGGSKEMTPGERRAAKIESHQGLEQWATDNNIPLHYLMGQPAMPMVGQSGEVRGSVQMSANN